MSWFAVATLILELATKYGVPFVEKQINLWNNELPAEPTIDDIRALADRLKPPEEYFK
jgi:hypothetical protein